METGPNEEQIVEDTLEIQALQGNLFARFAYKASPTGGKSHNTCGKAISANSSEPSFLGKRKAEEDEHVPTTSKIKRAGTTPAKPSLSRSSSSKVKVYGHLRPLQDNLETGLNIVFCGINPGQKSAEIGHHYGNPNNHFWSCLHESGLTTRRLDPREDASLPRDFSIGLTNLVVRPTAQENELSKVEQVQGVSILLAKVARYQPLVLCFVGLGIADVVRSNVSPVANPTTSRPSKSSKRTSTSKTAVGLQPYKMVHQHSPTGSRVHETLFFAVSSTSGRVVRYQKSDKIKQFQDLRNLVTSLKEGTLDTSNIAEIVTSAPSSLISDATEGTKRSDI